MPDPNLQSGIPKPVPAPAPTSPPPTPTVNPTPTAPPTQQPSAPMCELPQATTPTAEELPTPTSSTVDPATTEATPTATAEGLPEPDDDSGSTDGDDSSRVSSAAGPVPMPAPTPTPPPPVAARKQSIVLVYSIAPDVCLMPNGSPAAFDLCAIGTDAVNESPDVFANEAGVIKLDTTLLVCSGDEPAATGVFSGTIKNIVEMLPNGCRVIANKKVTIRDKDLCTMNNKNTFGIVTVVETPSDEDSDGPLDHVKRGSDVLEGYKDAAEQSDEADAAAKKAERGTGRGKRKSKRPESPSAQKDRARSRAQRKANLEKARAKAKKFEVPGKATKLGKVARGLPGVGAVIDGYQVYEAYKEGGLDKAADKSAGILAGKGAAALVGAVCLASGPGVLVCAGLAIGVDWYVGGLVEDAKVFTGKNGSTENPSPSPNPTAAPSENGVPTGGGSSVPTQPSGTPVPQPAPAPTSTPVAECVNGMGEDGILNLCINGPGIVE